MGLDWHAYPVRLDSDAVRAIRADSDLFETAYVHPPFYRGFDEPPPAVSQQLIADWPEGLEWNVDFLDRAYEAVEYLLDPVGRHRVDTWEQRERTLPYRIVHGDAFLAEHAVGTQGVPWRYSTRAFLTRAVSVIDGLDLDRVRAEYSVADMAALRLYKQHGRGDDATSFADSLDRLRRLADFYRRVVDAGFDVLIELD